MCWAPVTVTSSDAFVFIWLLDFFFKKKIKHTASQKSQTHNHWLMMSWVKAPIGELRKIIYLTERNRNSHHYRAAAVPSEALPFNHRPVIWCCTSFLHPFSQQLALTIPFWCCKQLQMYHLLHSAWSQKLTDWWVLVAIPCDLFVATFCLQMCTTHCSCERQTKEKENCHCDHLKRFAVHWFVDAKSLEWTFSRNSNQELLQSSVSGMKKNPTCWIPLSEKMNFFKLKGARCLERGVVCLHRPPLPSTNNNTTYTCSSVQQKPPVDKFSRCGVPGDTWTSQFPAAELHAAPHHRRVRSPTPPVIFCIAAASRRPEVPQRGLQGQALR